MGVTVQRKDAQAEDVPWSERRTDKRAAKDARIREQRQHREARRQRRAAARLARRGEVGRGLAALGRRGVFVVPLLFITGFAVFGQIGYGIDHYTPPSADAMYRLAVAIGAAIAIESIANFVQYKAHEARLAGASALAARLSRRSYLIAAGVAFINYQHFCGPGLAPTPGALVFAMFSFFSPWLWGLYTKVAEHEQRVADGTIDRAGAVFAAERWRQFPILTYRARRHSVMHNITDPVEAWNSFMSEYRRGVTARAVERRQRREAPRTDGLLVRWVVRRGGANPGATAVERGGAKHGVNAGAKSGAAAGSSNAAPAGHPSSVARLVRRDALTPDEQTSMRDAATDWAVAQAAKDGSVPGWRTIHGATDQLGAPLFAGLTEYAAKEAARVAKERVTGVPGPAGGRRDWSAR